MNKKQPTLKEILDSLFRDVPRWERWWWDVRDLVETIGIYLIIIFGLLIMAYYWVSTGFRIMHPDWNIEMVDQYLD